MNAGDVILQVCLSNSWGGLEMHVPIVAARLKERGRRVAAVCRRGSPIENALARAGVPAVPVRKGGYVAPRAVRTIHRRLRAGVGVVHSHESRDLWTVVPALRGFEATALVHTRHIHSGVVKRDPLHRRLFRRVDAWIATSRDGRGNLLETHPVDPARVHVVNYGVDPARITSDPGARPRVRRALGIGDERFVVGMVGRMSPNKGHMDLLEAVPRVRREAGPGVLFLIVGGASVGEDDFERAVRARAAGMAERDAIRFAGQREEIPDLLAAMDAFVLPSHKESFGICLIEAMAAGLPVVATAIGGPAEIVEADVSGLLVPPRSPAALAGALARLAGDDRLRQRLGRAAGERAREHYSEEAMVDRVLGVYEAARAVAAGRDA